MDGIYIKKSVIWGFQVQKKCWVFINFLFACENMTTIKITHIIIN